MAGFCKDIKMKSILHHEMKDFLSPNIRVDSHQAKLGKDNDVSVLKFESANKDVAKDLVSFIESGFKFVLDADFTPSKNTNGSFDIFVEVERNEDLPENIMKLTRDIEQVTGILPWKFSFYKNDTSHKLTQENLSNQIPTTASEYDFLTSDSVDEDIAKFFESAGIRNIVREGKTLTLKKLYSKHIFEMKAMDTSITGGIFKIDSSSESQSSYINSWLGSGFKVVKLDDSFKVSKNDKSIIMKAKDF
jgi:hypothetical protein